MVLLKKTKKREDYDKKSCFTCKNKIIGYTSANNFCFKCDKGKEVPESTVIEFCDKYEYEKEKDIASIFDLIFKATLKSKKEKE